MDKSRKRRPRELQVLDREALAKVAQFVASFAPTAVPRPTLFRLLNKQAPAIRQKTFEALLNALDKHGSDKAEQAIARLYHAALGADGLEISGWYRDFLADHVVAFFTAGAPYLVPREGGRGLRKISDDEGRREIDMLMGKLPSGAPSARLRDLVELQRTLDGTTALRMLEEFETWIAANGHGDALENPYLHWHVMRRILEPLLDAPFSGYVERHWRELSEEELRRFIAAGITREKIMLNRAPENRRIQAVLAGELPPTR